MSVRIAIVYFSGTGNTQAVTGFLGNALNEYFTVDVFRVEDILNKRTCFDLEKYEMIGIGHPVYGFNAPRIMFDFVRSLDTAQNLKEAFIFSTCAGPFYLNYIASHNLKKALAEKGFKVFYERQFYMPANIAARYNDEVCKQLCNAALSKAGIMAREIRDHVERIRKDNIGPRLLSWLYAWEKHAWNLVSKDFRVSDPCTKCGKCERDCPMRNITSDDNGSIRFGKNCLACYRCVYRCPAGAITGKKYRFAIFKSGYDINRIISDDKLKGGYITRNTWGYYRIFRRYLFKQ